MYETQDLDQQTFTRSSAIRLYDVDDFEGMRIAGRLVADALDMISPFVVPGMTTGEIDDRIRDYTLERGGLPACLGYKGYMKTVCTSINHVVCHGIPGDRVLKDGDIVNIDHTVIVDGWHGDSSRMYAVGAINARARKLIDVTYESLDLGLAQIKPGNTFGDIGYAIQRHVEAARMSVVRDFCGHGIGRLFHDSPNVLHYGRKGEGQSGQTACEGAVRRLDRRDPRQVPVGPV
jgi:methionyl aminopeptidase